MNTPMIESYRSARTAWEQMIEDLSQGYGPERVEAIRDNPPPTLKAWMRGYRRTA